MGAASTGDGEAGGRLRVRGPVALRGRLRMPGDKSISHRALLLSALAEGTSLVRGLSDGEDVAGTRRAIEALGATVELLDGAVLRIGGRGGALAEADGRRSTSATRAPASGCWPGVAASQPHLTILAGDASVHRRPMGRVVDPAAADGRRPSTDARAAASHPWWFGAGRSTASTTTSRWRRPR